MLQYEVALNIQSFKTFQVFTVRKCCESNSTRDSELSQKAGKNHVEVAPSARYSSKPRGEVRPFAEKDRALGFSLLSSPPAYPSPVATAATVVARRAARSASRVSWALESAAAPREASSVKAVT